MLVVGRGAEAVGRGRHGLMPMKGPVMVVSRGQDGEVLG